MAIPATDVRRLTYDDVEAMFAAGILDEDDRVDGVLVELTVPGPPRCGAVEWLNEHLVRAKGDDLRVRAQDTFLTPDGGFFVPDLMLVDRGLGRRALPAAAQLVVEVAWSSHARDRHKARQYALALVAEYWIVDVEHGELIVQRAPVDGAYTDVARLRPGDVVTPLATATPIEVTALLTD